MSSTAGGYGFICVRHPSGQTRANPYPIASGYATNIYTNDPVKLLTDGTIAFGTSDGTRSGTATVDIIGHFAGVQYDDANGKPNYSAYWPASTTATNIIAWVYDDPQNVYSVQADGSIASSAVGDQANFSGFSTGGSTVTGLSSCTLSSTLAGASSQAQYRIIGLDQSVNNAWGDAYTRVLVQIAQHEYIANKVAV